VRLTHLPFLHGLIGIKHDKGNESSAVANVLAEADGAFLDAPLSGSRFLRRFSRPRQVIEGPLPGRPTGGLIIAILD
jgi:hypothetical protein